MMIAKLHGIRVTGADLHYEGSIALDPEQFERAGLMPFEFVEIWNKNSGHRISTYIIPGRRGARGCVLNGAAARTCQVGDELIIAARAEVELEELATLRSRVVVFGTGNRIGAVTDHRFVRRADGAVEVVRVRTAARRARRA